MNLQVTILFGNGLDIGFGLETRYSDFYNHLIEKENDEELKNNIIFQRLILDYKNNESVLWKDYEKWLGDCTKKFNDNEIEKIDDDKIKMDKELNKFLCEQNSKLNSKKLDSVNFLSDRIPMIGDNQNEDNKDKINKILKKHYNSHLYIQPISFNYTDTVEKIFNIKNNALVANIRILDNPNRSYNTVFKKPFYLHGTLKEDMVVGVNDENQIINSSCKKNSDILDSLIKNRLLAQSGQQHMKKFKEIIENSDIICCYGLSIGETDKEYWKILKNRLLKNDTLLIIYAHDGQNAIEHIREKEKLKKKYMQLFYDGSECTTDEKNIIAEKIIVTINDDIFIEEMK